MGIARLLRDPEAFARVERFLEDSLGGDLGPGRSVFAHASDAARIGRAIFEVAEELGVPAARLAAQVLRDDPGALFVFRRPETEAWLSNTKQTVANDATIVASDGIYRPGLMHPRGYGTFPRFLRLATRERATLDLPTAIHMMTGRTAARYGVANRGLLRVEAPADVVVFDPETVAEGSTFQEPRRMPVGICEVIVNGAPVMAPEGAMSVRPGRLLAAGR